MKTSILALCAFIAFSQKATAVDTVPWATVGQWNVLVDQTLGYGCFIMTSYTKGTIFRVGLNNTKNKNGYVMIANAAWASVEAGKEYKLSLKFDDEPPWTAAFGVIELSESLRALYVPFGEANFLLDVGRKHSLTIYYNDRFVTTLPLTGSFAAIQSMLQCQRDVDGVATGAQNPRDPFANGSPGTRPAADPFR